MAASFVPTLSLSALRAFVAVPVFATLVLAAAGCGGGSDASDDTLAVRAPVCGGSRSREGGDDGFGRAGRVVTDFGRDDAPTIVGPQQSPTIVAFQRDGKFVVGGRSGDDFALARYLPDGKLDQSFGREGKVITHFGPPPRPPPEYGPTKGIRSLAVQDDGKIIATGGRGDASYRQVVVRYMPDGRLDRSFGKGGKLSVESAGAIAVQGDGKIVVADYQEFALARYTPNGRPDTSFGTRGRVETKGAGVFSSAFFCLTVQADGRIVALGSSALVRYTRSGQLDPTFSIARSFGVGGTLTRNSAILGSQPDGKIILYRFGDEHMTLARYSATGTLDRSFGDRGTVRTPWGFPVMHPDGHIVVAIGEEFTPRALARYSADGELDRSFGEDGNVVLGDYSERYGARIELQPDGKIILFGSSRGDFLLVRYDRRGRLDA